MTSATHRFTFGSALSRPGRRVLVPALLIGLCLPAAAASLKGIMGEMSGSTKSAKALLTSFDQGRADAVFARLAQASRSADALSARRGGDAEAGDMHARFAKLAAISEGWATGPRDATAFRTDIGAVVAECRSCHSAYRQ